MDVTQGCPGSQMLNFKEKEDSSAGEDVGKIESQLRQWPIQLHLVSPSAPYYQGSDMLLTADCVAYALGDFHRQFLKACYSFQVPFELINKCSFCESYSL